MLAASAEEDVGLRSPVRHCSRIVVEPPTNIEMRTEYPKNTFNALLAEVVVARTLGRDQGTPLHHTSRHTSRRAPPA